jgi:hypothetical protein
MERPSSGFDRSGTAGKCRHIYFVFPNHGFSPQTIFQERFRLEIQDYDEKNSGHEFRNSWPYFPILWQIFSRELWHTARYDIKLFLGYWLIWLLGSWFSSLSLIIKCFDNQAHEFVTQTRKLSQSSYGCRNSGNEKNKRKNDLMTNAGNQSIWPCLRRRFLFCISFCKKIIFFQKKNLFFTFKLFWEMENKWPFILNKWRINGFALTNIMLNQTGNGLPRAQRFVWVMNCNTFPSQVAKLSTSAC